MGQSYRGMEDLKSNLLALNHDFGRRRGRKLIVRNCKTSDLGDVLSKLVYSNVSLTRVWGRSPQPPVAMRVWGQSPEPLGDFCKFLEKKAILIHWITFRTCS